jgi:hypothetical protein
VEKAVFVHEGEPVEELVHDALATPERHGPVAAALPLVAVLRQVRGYKLKHEVQAPLPKSVK